MQSFKTETPLLYCIQFNFSAAIKVVPSCHVFFSIKGIHDMDRINKVIFSVKPLQTKEIL